MTNTPQSDGEYDVFLSHATPDKEWVLSLADRLEHLGLRVFVDTREIAVGQNFVLRLDEGLERSRYMVLVLSKHTEERPWVMQEWTSYLAEHGPLQRLLPVQVDSVALPTILKATQAIDATHREADRVADELFKAIGDPATLEEDDARRLVLGRDFVFTLTREGAEEDQGKVIPPSGVARSVPVPWSNDPGFVVASMEFGNLHRQPVIEASDRSDLFRHAISLGQSLFEVLFDPDQAKQFAELLTADRARPVVQIRSDDDLLMSLPWELLHDGKEFLVREGKIDLVRTTAGAAAGESLLRKPTQSFKLVVNVSAPEGAALSYEGESYRITLATAERCPVVHTELGTLEDLVETVDAEDPTGIHFSGHGTPGALLFENDEGNESRVKVDEVIRQIRQKLPDARRLPPFFYLASCHGNDPVPPGKEQATASSAAVQLHKAGVTEVVGYFGPIVDELSTRAEEAIYAAIAEGRSTRDAVRLAREHLKNPLHDPNAQHRPHATRIDRAGGLAEERGNEDAEAQAVDTHPFAWAQLVFYHRGPEWPLSVPVAAGRRDTERVLERRFKGTRDRKILKTGFIGRRREQHKIRRQLREGSRVMVLQGLGGLGKSTLAQRVLPWLTDEESKVCTLWCHEVEGEENRAEALVGQLLRYCRERCGLDWEGVVQQVDHIAGDDPTRRFELFLKTLANNAPGLVLYFDNLESLLVGPEDGDAGAFGQWAEPALEAIWQIVHGIAEDNKAIFLVATTRYRNPDFANALLPVAPLPSDALFRLTEWFPALRRLTASSRARLVSRLDGHPRAVEYANDLVENAFTKYRNTKGEWRTSVPPTPNEMEHEWTDLVTPCLPQVEGKLKDNLLLQALWDRVLDERARRFLHRMTVLRRPAEWSLLELLGEPDEPLDQATATAERLRDTSLLEQVEIRARVSQGEVGTITRYALHPATVRFIVEAQEASPERLKQVHRRIGEHLEAVAKESRYIEVGLEAGHHLFEGGEFDRACPVLGRASDWLRVRGRVREGLRVLEPFLAESVQSRMDRGSFGRVLGAIGLAYYRLGEFQKAIGYQEQALVIAREIGDRQGEANALGNLGLAYASLGEVHKAIGYYEQHATIAHEIGDRQGEGIDLSNLGSAYASLGEVHKAIGYYEQALVIAREIGNRHGEADALGNWGLAYARLGEFQKAIGHHEQALVISREIGDRQGEANILGNLGSAYDRLGEFQKAIGYHEQALVISREIGDRQGEGSDLGNLGVAYARLGEVHKAIGYHEEALVISRETGDRQGEANALGNLGLAYTRLGEVHKAIGYHEQNATIAREIGDRQGEGNALGNLGVAYHSLGEFLKAIGYHEQHATIAREIGDRQGEANALGNWGLAYASLGEVHKAIGHHEQALVISRETGDRQGEASTLGNLGVAYAILGEFQKAGLLLRQAKSIGEQIGDRRIVEVAVRALEKLGSLD